MKKIKVKSKSANISHYIVLLLLYVWRSLTELPNLNLRIFCNGDFGPNHQILIPTNISGYMVIGEGREQDYIPHLKFPA